MLLVAAVGGGAFVVASLVVSVRLLALARRTRQLPEFLIGLGLLLMGGVGYPLFTVARLLGDAPSLQASLHAGHALLSLMGQSAIAVFTWRVFRSDAAWARAAVVVFATTMAGLLLWQTVAPGWRVLAASDRGPWTYLPIWTLFVLAWAGIESLLYHAKLRKRFLLGLVDAATTDRLRLWSIAMLAAFATSFLAWALRALGIEMTPTLTGLIVGPLGIVSACAMWLAFLPPDRYLHWVLARAGAGA
jgi:hypothetical protein